MPDKYIILEIIPTAVNDGDIVQLSALKVENNKLVDRFDYRLSKENVGNDYLLELTSYDNDSFKYLSTTDEILNLFGEWINDYKLLYIDNLYTANYLSKLDNEKESILKYLGFEYSDDVIEKIIDKYKLESSNYIVDLLYEAIMFEN